MLTTAQFGPVRSRLHWAWPAAMAKWASTGTSRPMPLTMPVPSRETFKCSPTLARMASPTWKSPLGVPFWLSTRALSVMTSSGAAAAGSANTPARTAQVINRQALRMCMGVPLEVGAMAACAAHPGGICKVPATWPAGSQGAGSGRGAGTPGAPRLLDLDLAQVDGRLAVVQLHALESLRQHRGDDQVAVPLLVGRHHEPGRHTGRGAGDRFLVSCHEGVPALAIVEVRGAELPALLGVGEPFQQPPALLVAVDVEEELEDRGAVLGEQPLEVVDLGVARLPDLGGHEVVDALDQHRLVVAAVEDPDLAGGRHLLVDAPEEVVVELLLARCLEGRHPDAERVDALEDVGDGAVLAAGVHAL